MKLTNIISRKLRAAFVATIFGICCQWIFAQSETPRVFLIAGGELAQAKSQPQPKLVARVRSEADQAMKQPILSVMDKKVAAMGADKHEYFSMQRYFWPNAATSNHLPYEYRDGLSNPEADKTGDHHAIVVMAENAEKLAIAAYLTGESKYGEQAARTLRVWFLDPATRMNPDITYGQSGPGSPKTYHSGILDGLPLLNIIDAVGLLATQPAWSREDQHGMTEWFSQYYAWLTQSSLGKEEAAMANNHGTWYRVQAMDIALFLGKDDDARRIASEVLAHRIPSQIESDGSQPAELSRTRSFFYSAYNLQALSNMAVMAQRIGVDLWGSTDSHGPSTRKALDYLKPYAVKDKAWTHPAVDGEEFGALCPVLLRAAQINGWKEDDKQVFEKMKCGVSLISSLSVPGVK